MPKISVIVPVYKVEKYLNRCVDSILSQSFTDFELILVDDGSPDSSPAICDEYAAKYDFIHVIHKENGGLSDARNAGLKTAIGEYVMFLDSDDYLDDKCLQLLLDSDENRFADLIIGSVVYAYEDSDNKTYQTARENCYIEKVDFDKYLPCLLDERRLNYVHGKLYKKEIIKKFGLCFEDEKLTSAEDTVFNFTFLKYCKSIQVCSASVHFYMQHCGLASKFVEDRYKRFSRLSNFLETTCKDLNLYNEKMRVVINKRRILSAIWCKDSILKAKEIKTKKILLLDEISSDDILKQILQDNYIDGSEELTYLINYGGRRFIKYKSRQKIILKVKSFLYCITPSFIKNKRQQRRYNG